MRQYIPRSRSRRSASCFDTDEQIVTEADRIYQQTVVTRVMPIGNLTGMTDQERQVIDRGTRACRRTNDRLSQRHARLRREPPDANWPDGARTAVQFVINFEEGGENCVLHGDTASEAFLSEIVGAQPIEGQRHMNMESIYEYGSRAGFWRLHRMFTANKVRSPYLGGDGARA